MVFILVYLDRFHHSEALQHVSVFSKKKIKEQYILSVLDPTVDGVNVIYPVKLPNKTTA